MKYLYSAYAVLEFIRRGDLAQWLNIANVLWSGDFLLVLGR